jgi:hypothetical protein
MYSSECLGCGANYTIKHDTNEEGPRFCPFCGEVFYDIERSQDTSRDMSWDDEEDIDDQ